MPRPIKFNLSRAACGGDKVRPIEKFERFLQFPSWFGRGSEQESVCHLKDRPIDEFCERRNQTLNYGWLISKIPTNGHQFDQMRFARVEWRDPGNTGERGECSDARSTSTAETLPNNWQTTTLPNRETDLQLTESTRRSSGAEPRSLYPCGGSDRASLDASCKKAIPMILPRLRSLAARRRAWKAVVAAVRNDRCCK